MEWPDPSERRDNGLSASNQCPLFTRKRTSLSATGMSAFSELARRIFTSQAWSVQPCVRPVDAVHITAGHNALRGSGPGQKLAFDNALAQMGCPDRRIDRLCITCCSPSPTFTSRHDTRRDLIRPSVRPDNCTARPKPSWPRPFGQACWQARWLRAWWVAA